MKIAFIIQDRRSIYGAERATLDLAFALMQEQGIEVCVILISESRLGGGQSPFREALEAIGLDTISISTDRPLSFRLVKKLRDTVADYGVNVVHTIGPKATFHAFFAFRNRSTALVSTVHGWLFRRDLKERFYEWLERAILKRFSGVVVLSRYYEAFLLSHGFSPSRVCRIPTGLHVEDLPEVGTSATEDPSDVVYTVGMLGRFSEEKNYGMFLDAAAILVERKVPLRFLIAGEGPRGKWIHQQIQSLHLEKEVRVEGYMDAAAFMKKVDMLAVCSRIENLPYSVLEAMAWARPVVATRVGGLPDLIEEGETGWLCDLDDAQKMADYMQILAGDSDRSREMGKKGRTKLESEFMASSSVKKHLKWYQELLEGVFE